MTFVNHREKKSKFCLICFNRGQPLIFLDNQINCQAEVGWSLTSKTTSMTSWQMWNCTFIPFYSFQENRYSSPNAIRLFSLINVKVSLHQSHQIHNHKLWVLHQIKLTQDSCCYIYLASSRGVELGIGIGSHGWHNKARVALGEGAC